MYRTESYLQDIEAYLSPDPGPIYTAIWPTRARRISPPSTEYDPALQGSPAFDPSMEFAPRSEGSRLPHPYFMTRDERARELNPDGILDIRTMEYVREICRAHYLAGQRCARLNIEDSHQEWLADTELAKTTASAIYYLFLHPYERTTKLIRPYGFHDFDSAAVLLNSTGDVAYLAFRLLRPVATFAGSIECVGVKMVRSTHAKAARSAFILCSWIAVDETSWNDKTALDRENLIRWSNATGDP